MSQRRTFPPHRYTRRAGERDRGALAGPLGRPSGTFHAPNPAGPLGRPPTHPDGPARREAVRAGHVPVPVRRGPARRPPAGLHRHRHARPVPAHDGYNVLHAMGFDAFGLPAEQYAVQTGQHPREHHRGEHRAIPRRSCAGWAWPTTTGAAFATTDVEFYRWTQWIFLQIFNSWFDPASRQGPADRRAGRRVRVAGAPADARRPSLVRADRGRAARTVVDGHRLAYRPRRRSTGARGWARCWPTRRSPPTGAASAATSRCSSAT